MNEQILLVEDEPGLVLSLSDRLVAEGYSLETAQDGQAATDIALRGSFDLILLDVMLPEKSGMDVCRDLRQAGLQTPILMLTARGQTVDKVLGLKLGADDYLTKPFDILELLARIEALLRRARDPVSSSATHSFGDVTVDFRSAEVTRQGEPVELSALEYRLLRYLIAHRGELVTRDQLLDDVWGYDADVFTRTVDQHVSALRRKLEPDPSEPRFVLTRHGLGYKFVG